MFYTWLIIFVILLIIEFSTFNFITIWFALGAVAAMFASMFEIDIYLQTIIFAVISALSLMLTRPLVNKYLKKPTVKTNLDMIIGEIGIVTKDITETSSGEVKVSGKYWTAVSEEDIKEKERVEVLDIKGSKILVKKKEK